MSEQREMAALRDRVRAGVFAGIARRRVIRHRRTIGIVVGCGVLLAAGVGLGAARLVSMTPQQASAQEAVCYATPDTSQPTYFQNADGVPYDVVELCQEMWKRGTIGQVPAPSDPNDMDADFPVPDIALCRDADGFVAGFPIWDDSETAQELCDRLGLPVWVPPAR